MTIVFFLPVILRDEHRRIYPMEKLEEEGNRIIILDATQYFNIYKRTATDDYLIKRIVECKDKKDFVQFRENLGDDPVIFVTNELYMNMANDIFDLFIRKRDKLLTASTRKFSGQYTYPSGTRKILIQLIHSADKYLPLHHFKFYYKKWRKIHVPDYFLGSTKFLNSSKTVLSVKKENRIFVHSDDINQAFESLEEIIDPSKKIGVFLDQMLPYFHGRNPDVHNTEVAREYKITYYENLVRTLKALKNKFDLDDIVIALHPESRAIREEIDQKFSPFTTYVGVSHELIKDSSVVFGHYSTAIGMAAFYRKPIVLLTDETQLSQPKRKKAISSYVDELGVKCVDMEKAATDISSSDININKGLYDSYVKKFLKENDYRGNSYYYAINRIKQDLTAKKSEKIVLENKI